jgi:hypothetical protein
MPSKEEPFTENGHGHHQVSVSAKRPWWKIALVTTAGLTVATGAALGIYFGVFYKKSSSSDQSNLGTMSFTMSPLLPPAESFLVRRDGGNRTNSGRGGDSNNSNWTLSTSGGDNAERRGNSGGSENSGRRRGVEREFKPSKYTVASRTPFSYAVIDGFQVTLEKIQYLTDGVTFLLNSTNNSTANSTADLPSNQDVIQATNDTVYQYVTVGDFSANPITFDLSVASNVSVTANITALAGTFRGVNLRLKNNFTVKGYCQTASRFIYTTKNGYKALPLSAIPADGSTPQDYDYLSDVKPTRGNVSYYDIVNNTPFNATVTANNNNNNNNNNTTTTDMGAMLIVDTSFLFTCYDGSLNRLEWNDRRALPPFNERAEKGQQRSAFAPGRAGFGFSVSSSKCFFFFFFFFFLKKEKVKQR